MYRLALDWQRTALRPWINGGRDLAQTVPGAEAVRAILDHWLTNLDAGRARATPLSERIAREMRVPIDDRTLLDAPFVRVSRLSLPGAGDRRQVLLVAPYSGYAIDVAAPLVGALLGRSDVVVTEWRDARLVPLAHGGFGFDQQVRLVARVLRDIGPAVDVVALSQGTLPALVACARLAEDGTPGPRSLALLAGPLDPSRNPPPGTMLPPMVPVEWLLAPIVEQVGPGHPAAGRLVFPGLIQLVLIAMSHPGDYAQAQIGAWLEALDGRVDGWTQSLADLHAVSDIPAELARDMMSLIFREQALVRGCLHIEGRRVRPELIQAPALLTIEAGNDALVGPGQTHAAHGLCPRIAGDRRARVTVAGAEHYDLFTGPKVAREVVPALEAFFDRAAA